MKKEDYVFTIGFDGEKPVVDRQARSRYGRPDARSLADKGLFQAAYRSAVFDKNEADAKYILEKLNTISTVQYKTTEELSKLFGI